MNTEFVGVSSATGGSGSTSFCLSLARILSKTNHWRVFCISMDCLSSKMSPVDYPGLSAKKMLNRLLGFNSSFEEIKDTCVVEDDFGVSFIADNSFYNPLHILKTDDLLKLFESVSESGLYDLVIVDIPFDSIDSMRYLACCEKVIICKGYLSSQVKTNDKLFNSIKTAFEDLDKIPDIHTFVSLYDEDSFEGGDVDVHGQYGAEVRDFASQLFPKK